MQIPTTINPFCPITGKTVSIFGLALMFTSIGAAVGCGETKPPDQTATPSLANRAYIVARESEELTVIDLDRLEIIAQVPTGGVENHMAEVSPDLKKVYVDSSASDESVVVDVEAMAVLSRIPTGRHPAHLSFTRDGSLLAIMLEDEGEGGAVAFVDPTRDVVVKRLSGFLTPHFMRFSHDGRYGYVANIGGHHLSRVDMSSLEIDREISLDGFEGQVPAENESGFGDAQIDSDGMLFAAHSGTGRVLVYDTNMNEKRAELSVGSRPWVVFAEHPFANLPRRHMVPNFGDQTVSLIDGPARHVVQALEGDQEAYGVNYSSVAPEKAFVMNRVRRDIAVFNRMSGELITRIAVGGNTETAATTPDGKLIVAAVSGANRVVVIDVETNRIVKTFDDVGEYPWSVTIPFGQNYCH